MKVTIDRVTTIPAGVQLRLTPDQAAARAFALDTIKKGVFVVKQALQFKIGETVDIVDGLPKGILPVYDANVPETDAETAQVLEL